MAKNDTSVAETPAPVAAVAPEPTLSLDEFCVRLSVTEKRPEAIAGFHYTENAAGRVKGTQDEYASRFREFLNKPV